MPTEIYADKFLRVFWDGTMALLSSIGADKTEKTGSVAALTDVRVETQ
jgi:hypothetical protein